MVRTTLPLRPLLAACLLVSLVGAPAVAGPEDASKQAKPAKPVEAGPKTEPKPAARTATKVVTPALTKDEKLALALLGQMAGRDKAKAATAERLFARLDDGVKLRPLTQALRVEPASLRIRAAGELARIGDDRAVRPLLARVLREPSPKARAAIARAAGSFDVPGTVHTLARALDARDEVVRRRAAEALGYLGEVEAMPYLIAKWEGRSGDFPRVYFAQVKQVSYIQDYDVEVASTSFIADPIVGVAQPGLALGVKILATEQSQSWAVGASILQRSLSALAGGRHAKDAKGWRRWWDANGDRLLAPEPPRASPSAGSPGR